MLYEEDSTRGVQAAHAPRLRRILAALDAAEKPEDLSMPSFRLHALKGRLKGHWSIRVSGNWRVIFRFASGHVELVDYLDYH